MNAAEKAKIPAGFTPHSSRQTAFASAMLGKGVPITDVANWVRAPRRAGDVRDLRSPRAVRSGPRYRSA